MEDEHFYYAQTDIINLYMADNLMCATLMPNKNYNALLYKKHVIRTAGSYQIEFIEKYNLSVSIMDISTLIKDIENYLLAFDENAFITRCNSLPQDYIGDYKEF